MTQRKPLLIDFVPSCVSDNVVNTADELLRDPAMRGVFKPAIRNGSAVIVQSDP